MSGSGRIRKRNVTSERLVWCSLPPERWMISPSAQEEQPALWSAFKDESQGPSVSCLSQQPWQEVSLQTWWSHSHWKRVHPPLSHAPPWIFVWWQLCDLRLISEPQTETAVSVFPQRGWDPRWCLRGEIFRADVESQRFVAQRDFWQQSSRLAYKTLENKREKRPNVLKMDQNKYQHFNVWRCHLRKCNVYWFTWWCKAL